MTRTTMTPRAWNRFSYLLLACAILIVLVALAVAGVLRDLWLSLFPLALVLLLAGWLVLRTGRSTAATPAEVRRLIAAKQPVLLEFYSDFCASCMSLKPLVDRLERRHTGSLR